MKGIGAAYGFLASILVCAGLGLALDGYAKTAPLGVIGGTVLGFAAGLYSLQKALSNPDER